MMSVEHVRNQCKQVINARKNVCDRRNEILLLARREDL